ncbi:MAG: adenylate kinase [Alphaproteobacteria bacterium]|nr:adenylate kinase [Alphaproteobacteria bacterium]MDY4688998.1 adenylate kinase [Alphaproteobacteria bacterium]
MSEAKKGLYVVFTGAPGCGKGTQARILKEKTHICHLSTGEMLREYAAQDTPLGRDLKALLDKGEFATDEMIIEMVRNRIGQPDCERGFILDGFPRTLPQAEVLESLLAEKGIKLTCVLEIQVPDEIIMERILGRYSCLKCGAGYHDKFQKPKVYGVCDVCGGTEFGRRKDDNRATVQNRLVNYRLLTYPTIPFFEKRGLLRTVDGTGTIEAVSNKIDEILGI